MNAVIYSKDNCPWCDKAKEFFESKNIQYTEKKFGVDFIKEQLIELMPEVPERLTVPQIWINDEYIGGYTDLVAWWDND